MFTDTFPTTSATPISDAGGIGVQVLADIDELLAGIELPVRDTSYGVSLEQVLADIDELLALNALLLALVALRDALLEVLSSIRVIQVTTLEFTRLGFGFSSLALTTTTIVTSPYLGTEVTDETFTLLFWRGYVVAEVRDLATIFVPAAAAADDGVDDWAYPQDDAPGANCVIGEPGCNCAALGDPYRTPSFA